jgi:hypothetical protein
LAAPPRACPATERGPVVPSLAQAAGNMSDAYPTVSGGQDCFARRPDYQLRTCVRGVAGARVKVALVGNSHAAEWLPAIEQIARKQGWQITTYLASQCAAAEIREQYNLVSYSLACLHWVEAMTAKVTSGSYDLVIMANKVSLPAVGYTFAASWQPYQVGYERVLDAFRRAHLTVVGIHDSPAPTTVVIPRCLASHPGNYTPCDGTRTRWLPQEPLAAAMTALHDSQMSFVDLTDRICQPTICPAVVGGVVVYYDASHLTATYARTLAPYLSPHLRKAIAGAR